MAATARERGANTYIRYVLHFISRILSFLLYDLSENLLKMRAVFQAGRLANDPPHATDTNTQNGRVAASVGGSWWGKQRQCKARGFQPLVVNRKQPCFQTSTPILFLSYIYYFCLQGIHFALSTENLKNRYTPFNLAFSLGIIIIICPQKVPWGRCDKRPSLTLSNAVWDHIVV